VNPGVAWALIVIGLFGVYVGVGRLIDIAERRRWERELNENPVHRIPKQRNSE
jgi:hypothetical protein